MASLSLNLVVPEIYFQRKNWAFCWGSQLRLLITYFFLVLPLGGISNGGLCVEDRQRHWDCSSCIRKGGNIEAIIPVLERVATGDPLKRIFEMPSHARRDRYALGCHSAPNRTRPPAAHFSTAPTVSRIVAAHRQQQGE
ncbi:hypothetical protein ACVOMT_22085 (plasmid) [Sphingomonas panni]|uniref:hypothetical protein n=1 Tax=Sphingomonas panni TaxID=237612 RepID=UPI0037037B75